MCVLFELCLVWYQFYTCIIKTEFWFHGVYVGYVLSINDSFYCLT